MKFNYSKTIRSVDELNKIAEDFILAFPTPSLFCFHAEMGVGKTTFIQEILKQLGIQHPKGSPTYSLVNEYLSDSYGKIYHLDLYRIKDIDELYDMGFEDIANESHYVFLEWPERAENLLPEEKIDVSITSESDGSRTIKW